jgi:glyoxylase-like metal-dependent hydrolase (beta-lactamase superfamily II)
MCWVPPRENPQAAPAWTESGAHPVVPGVWRIPLPLPTDGLRAVNVYAVADGAGLTLIDGGWALDVARTELISSLGEIGCGLGDIRRFLVTHAHRDHYTQAVAIRREFGTPVLLGAGERPTIETLTSPQPPGLRSWFATLTRHGAEPVAAALRALNIKESPDNGYEVPDTWIASGQTFTIGERVLEAIETPGHTRGHVVFADRAAGLLFAGDHVLPHITPSVAFEVDPPRLGLRDYLASLRMVRAMPDMAMLPAHGPAGGGVHERIDELLAHHAGRLAEMTDVLRTGSSTAYDVATSIGWTSRRRKFVDLDPFNQMLAVFETALHLELLEAQGIVRVDEFDGVRHYSPIAWQ